MWFRVTSSDLAKCSMTRSIARPLYDSWASSIMIISRIDDYETAEKQRIGLSSSARRDHRIISWDFVRIYLTRTNYRFCPLWIWAHYSTSPEGLSAPLSRLFCTFMFGCTYCIRSLAVAEITERYVVNVGITRSTAVPKRPRDVSIVSLNISLSHSRSVEVIRNDTLA